MDALKTCMWNFSFHVSDVPAHQKCYCPSSFLSTPHILHLCASICVLLSSPL